MKKANLSLYLITAGLILIGLAVFAFGLDKLNFKEPELEININNNLQPTPEAVEPNIEPEPAEITLVAVGDIMLSRVVGQKMIKYNNYNYPFEPTADYIRDADIAFANLETAILPGDQVLTGSFSFRADPETAQALKDNGFDLVSLANNHTPNYGEQGLLETFKYLTEANVKYIGAGKDSTEAEAPVIMEVNGLTLGFLAYNDSDVVPAGYTANNSRAGTNFMEIEKVTQAVADLKPKVDLVIISMHSGTEYTTQPNQRQIDFAHTAVDAGADLIIGHHPHWVQEAEIYQGKYIFYSLGNFIFDQMWSEETRKGLIIKLTLTKEGVKEVEYKGVKIFDYSQPQFMTDEDSQNFIERLEIEN